MRGLMFWGIKGEGVPLPHPISPHVHSEAQLQPGKTVCAGPPDSDMARRVA